MSQKNKRIVLWCVVVILILVIGAPVIIHVLFKLKVENSYFVAEWSAGEFLGYYATVLSFIATGMLSVLALWQNEIIRREADRHTEIMEKMEIKKSQPFFKVMLVSKDIMYSNMTIQIKNISINIAVNLSVKKLHSKKNADIYYKDINAEREYLTQGDFWEVELENSRLEDMSDFLLELQCQDIYGNESQFYIQTKILYDCNQIDFAVKKINII